MLVDHCKNKTRWVPLLTAISFQMCKLGSKSSRNEGLGERMVVLELLYQLPAAQFAPYVFTLSLTALPACTSWSFL